MRYLLNIIYGLLIVMASPWLVYSAIRYGKYRDGWAEKFLGLAPKLKLSDSRRIWFHAVSVGEVNLLADLLERLQQVNDIEVVISTTTKTGYELAKKKYPTHTVFYGPLDFTWSVKNAFRRLQPTALVLVELELWPNLLMESGRLDIPVVIVNGRLSDKSTRGYLRLGGLMRSWMSNVSLVTAQSELCAERFVQIGVEPRRVHTVGSMKFDGAKTDRSNSLTQSLADLFDLGDRDVVFLAGSTQSPEEAMAVRVFERLGNDYPLLRLILVPRHPERFDEVARILAETDVQWKRRTKILPGVRCSANVLLVDTIGELGAWWGCAHIGFVGGSFGSRGGQNMIEPAAYGVATSFGPKTKNFRDVVTQLVDANAAEVVADEAALFTFVKRCLDEPEYRAERGRRAQQLVMSQRGSTDATVKLLLEEIAPKCVAFARQPPGTPGPDPAKSQSTASKQVRRA